MTVLYVYSGLPGEERVHCHPGTSGSDHPRLLADGMGTEFMLYHHAHQCRGEEQSKILAVAFSIAQMVYPIHEVLSGQI